MSLLRLTLLSAQGNVAMICLIRSSVNNLRCGSDYGDCSSSDRSCDDLCRSPGVASAGDRDAPPPVV